MGYYIQTPHATGKALQLQKLYGAKVVSVQGAEEAFLRDEGVVCVVENGMFDAAGFMFDAREFKEFANPQDRRRKTWLVMDRKQAAILSGYQNPDDEEDPNGVL